MIAGLWPSARLDNAGALAVREHIHALADAGARVTLVVPGGLETDPRALGLSPSVGVVSGPAHVTPSSVISRAFAFAGRSIRGELTPGRAELAAWRASASLEAVCSDAAAVEVHWSQYLPLISHLRRIAPHASILAVEHDVMTQGLSRRARAAPQAIRRLAAAVALAVARRREPRLLNRYDRVATFSGKDRDVLLRLGVDVPISEHATYVHVPDLPARRDEPVVLFTGAMYRPENDASALWLLDRVWPLVTQAVPDARVVIAGSGPSQRLLARAGDGVQVTGYVQDLEAFYEAASVFACPLVLGAGVKFKVPQAMAYGLPVVSTSIGAEGIPRTLFAAVADEPAQFAGAVVDWLRRPGEIGPGRVWAESRRERFAEDSARLLAAITPE